MNGRYTDPDPSLALATSLEHLGPSPAPKRHARRWPTCTLSSQAKRSRRIARSRDCDRGGGRGAEPVRTLLTERVWVARRRRAIGTNQSAAIGNASGASCRASSEREIGHDGSVACRRGKEGGVRIPKNHGGADRMLSWLRRHLYRRIVGGPNVTDVPMGEREP